MASNMRFLVATLCLLAACGDPSPEQPAEQSVAGQGQAGAGAAGSAQAGQGDGGKAGQSGAAQAGAGSASAGQGGAAGAACEPGPGVCVQEVTGVVVDTAGAPVGSKVVTVCGQGCFVGTTDALGSFRVPVGAPLEPETYALFVHGRPTHASVYRRLPALTDRIVFPYSVIIPELPSTGPSLPDDGAEASQLTSGALTLGIAAGTTFELDIDDLADEQQGRLLRVAAVEPGQSPFAPGVLVAMALAPFGARLSQPASIAIAGVSGLTEGQQVEFLALDDELLSDQGNLAGLLRVVATGQVKDGVLVSDVGQGLDRLTWLAARAQE